jgi:hypothetical protein
VDIRGVGEGVLGKLVASAQLAQPFAEGGACPLGILIQGLVGHRCSVAVSSASV